MRRFHSAWTAAPITARAQDLPSNQRETGTNPGTVPDRQGAVIAGADIRATGSSTGQAVRDEATTSAQEPFF